jgi:hypothetical protein
MRLFPARTALSLPRWQQRQRVLASAVWMPAAAVVLSRAHRDQQAFFLARD